MKHEAGEQADYRCREDFLQKLGRSGKDGQNGGAQSDFVAVVTKKMGL